MRTSGPWGATTGLPGSKWRMTPVACACARVAFIGMLSARVKVSFGSSSTASVCTGTLMVRRISCPAMVAGKVRVPAVVV